MWLFGGAIFIDSLDNYVGGGILAQLILIPLIVNALTKAKLID